MSLLDELKAVKPGYSGITNWTVLDEVDDVEEIYSEYQGSGRWEEYHLSVFKRGDELVGLEYSKPATEVQEGQDQSVAEFYPVEAYEVTETKYRKI